MTTRAAGDEELVRVTWRRGYLSGAFVAVRDHDATELIAESPKFRWRNGGTSAPPELPQVVACLSALEAELAAAGWEREGAPQGEGEWFALRFRRSLAPLTSRLQAYGVDPDEDIVTWLTDQAFAAADDPIFGEEPWRVEAIRGAVKRRDEERRLAAEYQEVRRLEAERQAAERAAAERREAELRETERLQAELLDAARREAQRLAAEQRETPRVAAEPELEHREDEPAEAPVPKPSDLHSRLSAYGVTAESKREIRAAFGPKPASPRKRRFIW